MDSIKIYHIIEPWLSFICILAGTFLLVYLFNKIWGRFIKLSSAKLNNNPTNYKFIGHTIRALLIIVGIGLAINEVPKFKTLASSLLAGAGIFAVALGFASQHALGNVISGLFIVIFKPFRVNDRLKLRDNKLSGIVEDITLRHTILRDFENKRIIIPNTIMSDEVIINANFNDDHICKHIEFMISYDSNIDLAKSIIRDEVMKHPFNIDNRTPDEIANDVDQVQVRVITLGEFGITLRAWAWSVDTDSSYIMSCDLLESIKKRFDKEGVEMPYPHYVILRK
ncbi:MAG: mechanosensitive ion channel family protein [Saprospiraceae bacterium]|nr:mechanosensitive ion channel family protein [Saprospiraceae bacterium]